MVEPQELASELGRPALGQPIIRWPHEEAPAWTLLSRVRQRHDLGDRIGPADERAAALVRISFLAVSANRLIDGRADPEAAITHRDAPRTARSDTFLPRRETPSR